MKILNRMEPISSKSAIKVARDTDVTRVAHTEMSFSDWMDSRLYPTTPITPSTRQCTFQILPQNCELHPPSCNLVVKFKITNADGSALAKKTQISCVNALGITCWNSVVLRIAGQTYLPEFGCSDHATYFKLHGCMTERERETNLEFVGYKMDTPTNSDSERSDIDPTCDCQCARCPCVTRYDENETSSRCINEKTVKTAEEIDKLPPRSSASILQILKDRKELNYGLYFRQVYRQMVHESTLSCTGF